ncbi:MAG: hypothetical protein IKN87_01605 [Bacilli bacterium]|nr:hypothetical protein [Bacilli bacterium]
MKVFGGIALFTLGAATAIIYDRYGQPVMEKACKDVDHTMKKASRKLEEMM